MRVWKNPGNQFTVARVHYTSDPARRGRWKYENAPAFGGLRSWRWRKEQEIDWEAMAGRLVFPMFDELVHVPNPRDIPESWPRWVLIDPGWTNPTSILWVAVDTDAKINSEGFLPVHVYREFHQARRNSQDIARVAHDGSLGVNADGAEYLEQIEEVLIDPGSKQEHQSAASPEKSDESAETVFEQIQAQLDAMLWSVPLTPGNNHKQESITELVQRLGNFWVDHQGMALYDSEDKYRLPTEGEILEGASEVTPTIFIHANCVNTIREVRGYRWADWASAEVREKRNDPEKPVDKDDHSVTNLIRFANYLRNEREQEDGSPPVELKAFRSRFSRRVVKSAEDTQAEHHKGAAARYRRKRRAAQ
jgi:hypothetical protein